MSTPGSANDYEAPIVDGRVRPSGRAQALLLESHTIASRAWLLSDDGTSRSLLPLISGGSVSCDPTSTVRRTATLSILAEWPDETSSRLTPYGSRVQVQRGVRVAVDAIEWMTLMTGPIWETGQDADAAGPGAMSIPLKDEMAIIAADRFDTNTFTDTTLSVAAQVTALIRRTLPLATVIDLSGPLGQTSCGKLDMQKDPAAGLGKLAASIGCEVYCGRGFQEFVLAPVPSLADPPRWSIELGGDRANIVTVSRKRTREKVYNRVFAYGETNDATDGGPSTPPPSGEARIDDPTDPLRYGGPFGRATRFFASPLLTTDAQATTAAAAMLEKLRGANLETDFTTLVNPALDGGDVIVSRLADGVRRIHISDGVTLPLGPSDTQSIPTRGLELPEESADAA